MATSYGYAGDVNNSIGVSSAYPGGRTFGMVPPSANRFRVRNNTPGELGAANQGDRTPMMNDEMLPPVNGDNMRRPLHWWIMLLIIFVLLVWLMKRFAPGEQREFGNISPGLYNGVFLTLYIVLILNVLKVFATKFKIPGLSELILAA
jgi:hypothetical protein